MSEEEQMDEHREEEEEEEEEEGGENQAGFGLDLMQYLLHARFIRDRNADTNAQMVSGLKKRGLLSKESERAFLAVPRGDFLLPNMMEEAYQDTPLRFATLGFNISAPHMYATCFDELAVEEGNTFLDIGSGCGHMTCLAGFTVGPRGKAHGLDIRQDIVDLAESNKKKFESKSGIDLSNVTFEMRNCFIADVEDRAWDRIHVGACCPKYKLEDLQKLLSPGGIMVTPYDDQLIKVTKDPNTLQITTKIVAPVRYSDLIVPSDAEMRQAEIAAQRYRATRDVMVPDDTLVTDFEKMANNEKYSDVIFKIKGKTVYAHKFMLALRCPYLHTLVQSVNTSSKSTTTTTTTTTSNNNNNKNSVNNNNLFTEVAISNIPYDVFVTVLKYIYCGEIRINFENVSQILQAGNELNLSNLTQTCQSYMLNLSQQPAVINAPVLLQEPLQAELAALVNSERLSDVVFCVEDDGKASSNSGAESGDFPYKKQKTDPDKKETTRVYGHRFILSLRSEYFRSIFTTGMREAAQEEVAIPEVRRDSFLSILRFVYTGDRNTVTEDNVIDLLEAANYFSESRLKCVCEHVLKRGVEIDNVAYVLDVATRFEADQLRNACIEFILQNFDAVSKTKTFADLDREMVVELTSEACKRLRFWLAL